MERARVIFMGTPLFAVPVLEGLVENYDVILVVSQPDKKVGRHQELVNTPIKEIALKNNIRCIQPIKIREDYKEIIDAKPDIIVTCAYGQIIPKEVLDSPRFGSINVHASLLPKLRGGAPIHKALIDGYSETGITIMYMDSKMDSGDIIYQEKTAILDSDNLETLYDRLSLMGRDVLLKTLPSILSGTNNRIRQNSEEVTYAYNITREEEHIDFNKSRREIFNLIRGLFLVPGAFMIMDGVEVKVYKAIISNKVFPDKRVGEVVGIYKNGIGIKCSDGEIIITDIKPFGKKRMDVGSYLNGIKEKDSLLGKVME